VRPQDYEIVIRPLTEAEGGGFGAIVPELPGCMSDSETPQEALENVYDAIGCWMEAAQELGRPVPSRNMRRRLNGGKWRSRATKL
jgi:predicted RNase H-like HicB family nuclease